MAQWNQTEKILHTKIVYYGPALSGKTTNLQQVHRFTDPRNENRIISLNTASDRTLFFDLLALDLGRISGYSVKVQLYTVPGQVRYDATRKVVLSGADAVVFVADSQAGKTTENRAAWENLKTNLKANGLDPTSVPIIIQLNKQDVAGGQTPKEIGKYLKTDAEGIPASALQGQGVMETFRQAVLEMLRRLSVMSGRRRQEELLELERQAERTLSRFAQPPAGQGEPAARPEEPAGESPTTIQFADDGAGEDLLARSLKANLGVAERFAEMRELKTRLQRRVGELEGLQSLTRELTRHRDAASIMNDLVDAAMSIPAARGASLLTQESVGSPLVTVLLRGFESDPLTRGGVEPAPAENLLRTGEPVLLDELPDHCRATAAPDSKGVSMSAVAVPMRPTLQSACLLLVYGDEPFGVEDLRYLRLLGAHATVCLDNVSMTERLTAYSERLENEVRARTLDLERANEDLRELDRMKDRFLSSVSHEMKTPLTGIISGAELLAVLTPEGDERREFVGMIGEEAQRLATLLDQVLRFQVFGRKESTEANAPVDPRELIARALREIEPAAAARGILIEASVPDTLPTLAGDSERLALALHEVLDNAVKFSPKGEKVEIEAGEADRFLLITVRDSGPGIPPEEYGRIFETFEQLGDILTSKPEGLGLGLPIAREIIRRHGGDLRVESAVGRGTEFHITLPASTERTDHPIDAEVEVAD